jgi:hypothetical protein
MAAAVDDLSHAVRRRAGLVAGDDHHHVATLDFHNALNGFEPDFFRYSG